MASHAAVCLRQNKKDRPVADGRRGGHNDHTHEQESLLLPVVHFVVFAVRAVILAILEEGGHSGVATHDNSLGMTDWLKARLGTDDMLDAFRQLPSSLSTAPSTPSCGMIRGRRPVSLPL